MRTQRKGKDRMRWLLALILSAAPALAEGERAGSFDYYVLALSWAPTWCALEGDARDAPHCARGRRSGWVLHGLWPQFETGWPSYCRTAARDPSRGETAAMADLLGSSGAAWHQWRKHGRCAGLAPGAYFAAARQAFGAVARPDLFARLDRPVRLPAPVVEEAFLDANPDLRPDMLTVTCRDGRIHEVRICLSKSLAPRTCGADVARDCTRPDALLAPVR
jgi:ribonuclease T2